MIVMVRASFLPFILLSFLHFPLDSPLFLLLSLAASRPSLTLSFSMYNDNACIGFPLAGGISNMNDGGEQDPVAKPCLTIIKCVMFPVSLALVPPYPSL